MVVLWCDWEGEGVHTDFMLLGGSRGRSSRDKIGHNTTQVFTVGTHNHIQCLQTLSHAYIDVVFSETNIKRRSVSALYQSMRQEAVQGYTGLFLHVQSNFNPS